MADTNIHLDVMIIEAGILANSLTPNEPGMALATKIIAAADAAFGEQKTDVVIDLNPVESGMLLDGLSRSQGNVTGDLIQRIFVAVNELMQSLNVQPLAPSAPNPLDPQPSADPAPAAGMDPSATDSSTSSDSTSTDSTSSTAPEAEPATPTDSSATQSTESAPTESTSTSSPDSAPTSQGA